MKVIFLTDVPKVGKRHDVKDFADGYAINVLISKGLAEMATPQALARLESKKNLILKKKQEDDITFQALIDSLNNKTISIHANANEKGHLFKSVSTSDIASAIKSFIGIEIDENSIKVDHIKEIGSHTVVIKRGDRVGKCKIIVEDKK